MSRRLPRKKDFQFIVILLCFVLLSTIPFINFSSLFTTPSYYSKQLDLGKVAEGEEKWQKALEIYKEIIKKEPNHADLWVRMADIEIHLKNYSKAEYDLNRAIQYQPKDASIYEKLSSTYALDDKTKEAIIAIEQAIQLDPENISFWKKKAELGYWMGDYSKVENAYENILKLDPKDESVRQVLNYLKEKKSKKMVFTELEQAEKNKDWAKAVDIYQKLLEKNPNNGKFWMGLALNEKRLKDFEKAALAFNRAIELDPKNISIYEALAYNYSEANQPKKSLEIINEALKIEPKNLNLLKEKVIFATEVNDDKQLEEALLQILKINPHDKKARAGLKKLRKKK